MGTSTTNSDWYLDYDANGSINGSDFAQFAARFGKTTTGSYTGNIVWNSAAPYDLYYSSTWQVLEEEAPNPTTQASQTADQYVWGQAYVDELVLRDGKSPSFTGPYYGPSTSGLNQRLYVLQDANWNTTGLILDGSTLKETFIYDPYGNATPLNALGTAANADTYSWLYLHQGGRKDPVTGLYDFRHRVYSPTLGRWGEEDHNYRDGTNLYQYLTGDPVDSLDPLGLCTCGPEVGPLLNKVFAAVNSAYKADGFWDQFWLTRNLTFLGGGGNGWDINSLVLQQAASAGCGTGTGSCYGTVMVNGKCFPDIEVNYWLYGAAARAISEDKGNTVAGKHYSGKYFFMSDYSNDLSDILEQADAYLSTIGLFKGGRIDAKEAWILAGFNNDTTQTSAQATALPNCKACTTGKTNSNGLNGHWGTTGSSQEILFNVH